MRSRELGLVITVIIWTALCTFLCGNVYEGEGILIGLAVGLITGVGMAISQTKYHHRVVQGLAGDVNEETLGNTHTRSLEIPFPVEKAYELCKQALQLIGGPNLLVDDPRSGVVSAVLRSAAYRSSHFDRVTIQFSSAGESGTQITVTSKPNGILSGGADLGRNLKNVTRIVQFLESVSDAYNEGRQG